MIFVFTERRQDELLTKAFWVSYLNSPVLTDSLCWQRSREEEYV